MTEYVCNKKVCEIGEEVSTLLRGSRDDDINGSKTVIGSIAEATQTPGKKWVVSSFYSVGDLVGLNGNIYVCIKDNVGKNPELEREFWNNYIVQYYVNRGKIAGYLQADGEANIIKSSPNIVSLTKSSAYKYYLEIDMSSFVDYPVFLFSGFESSTSSDFFELDIQNWEPQYGKLTFRIKSFNETLPNSALNVYNGSTSEFFNIIILGNKL